MMEINEQTKIGAILKHHPDALETIVKLSDDFKKLRNPLLRKLMAGRATIAMACKMGGCKPQDFFQALAPLGFEYKPSLNNPISEEVKETAPRPSFLQSLKDDQIVEMDVRSLISSGTDPLRLIQQTVKELSEGQVLKIINSFEPIPLIKLLEKQGFLSFVETKSDDLIETYFYKTGNDSFQPIDIKTESTGDWNELLQQFNGNLQHIDVRHLEMPQPMMTILEALEKLPRGKALYVQHKRIPVFLLTELKDRNFDFRIKEVKEGEVYLLIFHNN
ncbi:MAG: DUF2249 domain-containing protein [Bacteroidetes bacterium]|nr:DUF2249 domain-containing protein [Bacteroidota bacterium]MBS1739565.1 DUF2249 domain-containing protein [Bacteroidota bacterium]